MIHNCKSDPRLMTSPSGTRQHQGAGEKGQAAIIWPLKKPSRRLSRGPLSLVPAPGRLENDPVSNRVIARSLANATGLPGWRHQLENGNLIQRLEFPERPASFVCLFVPTTRESHDWMGFGMLHTDSAPGVL